MNAQNVEVQKTQRRVVTFMSTLGIDAQSKFFAVFDGENA